MNTRMFPGQIPKVRQQYYDNWHSKMLEKSEIETAKLNKRATARGYRTINTFKRQVKAPSTQSDLLLLIAKYWIKRYKFLPDSIEGRMQIYLYRGK